MFILSRPWTPLYLAPEGAGGGDGSDQSAVIGDQSAEGGKAAEKAEPARYSAEDLAGLGEGAELLAGALIDPNAELDKDEEDAEEAETRERLEAAAKEEDGGRKTEDDEAKGGEEKEQEQEKEKEAEQETGATQLSTLNSQLAEAKAEAQRLAAEIETLKNSGPASAPVPTRENPLAQITNADELRAQERLAIEVEEWADENRSGGRLPPHLVKRLGEEALRRELAELEGVAPQEIEDPSRLPGVLAMKLLKNSKRMLREHLPARREYLQKEQGIRAFWQREHPEYLDASKPEGQMVQALERQFPHLKSSPAWLAALAAMARGSAEFEKEAGRKKKTEDGGRRTEDGRTPQTTQQPVAPVPPRSNGARTGTSKPSQARPVKLRTDMTDDELAETM